MSSGVKWNEDYTDPNSDVARSGASFVEPGVNPIVSYMKGLPRANEPGTKFTYNTAQLPGSLTPHGRRGTSCRTRAS
jgi:hypothetical protein